uniref:NADH dehydrogenase subunit 6 n=1 Tax=Paralepas cf. quadrata TaxID=2977351 RepID=UPI0021CCBB56|nr:NADH dehydrogenase subunit 6 [Paralepas cf. quadrata]UWM12970.1 NADH dehydrogenase subunit 6 [Paralepas cf. quadrata]
MMTMTLWIVFIINILFLFMFHPLSMIFTLIVQSVFVSILVFLTTQFPWFSYTLILVFLGGMLVLFTYMANVASNEKFSPNSKILLVFLSIPIFIITNPYLKIPMTQEDLQLSQDLFNHMSILKPFYYDFFPLILIVAAHIILTLLAVVKISKMNKGPMRVE